MSEATLETGKALHPEPGGSGAWLRRGLLALFCLVLLLALGGILTQLIAARVPEQRATLEKLITDRTGLAVRFDNVHFAWGMEGASAVFERVELTDPAHGRVRVVAPELRVAFDAWDFLRHQRFTLGHVTVSSPDIDIVGDAEAMVSVAARTTVVARPVEDEAALLQRYTAWAELMPVGRIEVEGARVHLFHRGERAARHHFTLSQAELRRTVHELDAFGTLLLSQDIGQSLFVSARLSGLRPEAPVGAAPAPRVSGELRVIARRVLLERLPALAGLPVGTQGSGTIDVRLTLRAGLLQQAHGTLSARALRLPGGVAFDHVTVQGDLRRAAGGFELGFKDLQLTRGQRRERVPELQVGLETAPGTLRVARVTAHADYLPFLASQGLMAAVPAAVLAGAPAATDWQVLAGQLRDLRLDSRARRLSARAEDVVLMRRADQVQLRGLAADLELSDGAMRLDFADRAGAEWQWPGSDPRPLRVSGVLMSRAGVLDFQQLRVHSGVTSVALDGPWRDGRQQLPLAATLTQLDRAWLAQAGALLGMDLPSSLQDLREGRIVSGQLALLPQPDRLPLAVDWGRSRGTLQLANLDSQPGDLPAVSVASGVLRFARGSAQLQLTDGMIDDLRLDDARVDWPRRAAPRLRASVQGSLPSALLARTLRREGLHAMTGAVTLDVDARGEAALRDPDSWRITARVSNASVTLAEEMPPVEGLNGTVRLAAGHLRGLQLDGTWLGGPVRIESRRPGTRGVDSAVLTGVTDAAPLLQWLGQSQLAAQVSGQFGWSGSLERVHAPGGEAVWQLALSSPLSGVESHLPWPFDKARARPLPVTMTVRLDTSGVREFSLAHASDQLRGRLVAGVSEGHFEIQGVTGSWRAGPHEESQLELHRLDVRGAPTVLGLAGMVLPEEERLRVQVAELRHANRGIGGLAALVHRQAQGIEFSLASAADSPHALEARGHCARGERCSLDFALDTSALPALMGDVRLPADWPAQSLHASGELSWDSATARAQPLRDLAGRFEIETQGAERAHQLMASAVLAHGRIDVSNVQGISASGDRVFHGSGQVGLLARTFELTVQYEPLSLAASAMPPSARMRLSRAWSTLRGSAGHSAWAEPLPTRTVQWRGTWDADLPLSAE